MKPDKDTAWYDKEVVPKEMIRGANGELWPRLEHSDHFRVLNELIYSVPVEDRIMVDVGCGAGEAGRVFKDYYYVGADLPHIIDGVAKEVNPSQNYVKFDIYSASMRFVENYPVVLLNAFIDVLEHPVECLDKILRWAPKYVILHRQKMSSDITCALEETSYGDKKSYLSVIGKQDFIDLLIQRDFQIVRQIPVFDKMSYLLENVRK